MRIRPSRSAAYLGRRTGVTAAAARDGRACGAARTRSRSWRHVTPPRSTGSCCWAVAISTRARAAVCAEVGLSVPLDAPLGALSGGEAARAQLAAVLLARFDVFLLDEPTNDLDFAGLDRLERFVDESAGVGRRRVARP